MAVWEAPGPVRSVYEQVSDAPSYSGTGAFKAKLKTMTNGAALLVGRSWGSGFEMPSPGFPAGFDISLDQDDAGGRSWFAVKPATGAGEVAFDMANPTSDGQFLQVIACAICAQD